MNQFLDMGIPTAAQAASKIMRMGPDGPVPEFPAYAPAPTYTPMQAPRAMSPLQMFAEGGEASSIEERNPVTPMPGTKSEEAPLEKIAKEVSQSKAPGSAIQDWAKKLQERGQKISLIPDLVTPGSGNLEGESEEVQTLSSLLQQNKFAEAFSHAQENNLHRYLLDNEKLKNLRTPFTRQEAEEFMYAAPKDFFVSAGELANEQSGKTSSRSFDELYSFDPKRAIESLGALAWVQPGEGGWSMSETGYPLLGRALEPKELKKEPNWFDNLIKGVVTAGTAAALAYVGGTALLGSSGAAGAAGTAGTAGAAGTGGGALAGIQAAAKTVLGIPEVIGKTVAEALGAGVVKSTTAKMIGNAIISGGITGAKGGDLEDVLKSAALAAGFTFVSDKAIEAVADKLQSTGITDAVKDLPTGGDATAAASSVAQNAASKIVDGLQEVVVTGSRFGDIAGGIGAAGALASAQDILRESPAPDIEMPAEEQLVAEQLPPDELEEVVVQSLRKAPPRDLQNLLANLGTAGTQDILSERDITEMQEAEERIAEEEPVVEEAPLEDIEEVTVTTERPITDYLNVPPFNLIEPPDVQDILMELPPPDIAMSLEEQLPPDELEEVVVQSLRKAPPRDLQNLLANLSTAGTQDIFSEREIAEMQETEQEMMEEEPPAEEEEVIAADPFQTFKVTTRPLTPLDWLSTAAPTLATQGLLDDYRRPLIEETPELSDAELADMEEIVVRAQPPTQPLDLTDLTNIITTQDIVGDFDKPRVDPFSGELEEVVVTAQPTQTTGLATVPFSLIEPPDPRDILRESPAPDINYPERSTLEKLFDKYGTLENLIKLAGMVGAGAGAGAGGAGAGVPAYDPRLSAGQGQWIDWEKVKADAAAAGQNLNTYVARNWNQIQNRALEAGMAQPTVPSYNTPRDYEPEAGDIMNFAEGSRVRGPGSGREDLIPALLSDGEYVIDAETMALLGDGSVEKAADLMDDFREKIRKHKGATLAKGGISPNAKSPLQYLMGK